MIINGIRSTTVDLSIWGSAGVGPGTQLFLVYTSYFCVLSSGVTLEFAITAMSMNASCTPNLTYTRRGQLQACVATAGDVCGEAQGLVAHHKLKINSDKTEFMVITTLHYQTTYRALQPAVSVGGISVHAASSLGNLGVIMDSTMDMHGQIQSVKCAMFHHLRTISNIRRFLDRDTCVKAVLSLVMSRVDYCNSLLVGQSAAVYSGDCSWPRTTPPAWRWVCADVIMSRQDWRGCTGCRSTSESATN